MPDNSASKYNAGPEPSELTMTPWSMKPESSSPFPNPGAVSASFLFPEHRRPQVKHDEFTDLEVPVIDMANEDDAAVVSQVREACMNWGFFQIENHGIEEELLVRLQQQAEKFFSLPYAVKEKVSKPPGKFAGYGHATVKEGEVRPWSEGFYFTDAESTVELGERIWPPGTNNDFVDSYKEYNDEVRRLSGRLMRIIVAGLEGVKAAHFKQYLESDQNGEPEVEEAGGLLRWNYYPACPEPDKTLGLTEHTDFNLLTVVHQGLIGGLQILHEERWIAVKPRPRALAVNLGDMLQVLTNGRYKSVPHRAVVNASQSRISLVYFYVPLPSIVIVPAPELVDRLHPLLYKPFVFEEYTRMKQLYFLNTLDHFLIDQQLPTDNNQSACMQN